MSMLGIGTLDNTPNALYGPFSQDVGMDGHRCATMPDDLLARGRITFQKWALCMEAFRTAGDKWAWGLLKPKN